MGSDYVIYYTVKFTERSLKAIIKRIQQSDYYNGIIPPEQQIDDTMLKGKAGDEGIWHRTAQGYRFYKRVGGKAYTEYVIDLNTVSRIASFQESAN